MTTDDLLQIEAIIRRVIREEGLTYSGPSAALCGEPDFLQRSAALDEQARVKEARLAEKLAKKRLQAEQARRQQ